MSNTTSTNPTLSSLNLGGGLIEVAALTALIGSTTVESLMLGNQGAAGLVWGTIGIFGAILVIKARISATTPGWLRETLGVRTKEIDAAVGLTLSLDSTGFRSRKRVGGAIGLACKIKTDKDGNSTAGDQQNEMSRHEVYAFDHYTAETLEAIPDSTSTDSHQAYLLIRDPHTKEIRVRHAWRDWAAILISMSKVVELAILWKHDAVFLSLIGGLPWLYFFLSAILLQLCGLSRDYSETANVCDVDLVAGQLPTPMKIGGPRKILLSAPENVRNHVLWKASWAIGSLVSTAVVIATYITLSRQQARVFGMWTAFQFFWLAVRSVFYHFAEGTGVVIHYPLSLGQDWKAIEPSFKTRILRLALALSTYQIHLHPRGAYSYEEDAKPLHKLENLRTEFALTPEEIRQGKVELSVTAVIGDTVLSSACWILGSELTGLQLYDSCIIVLDIRGTSVAIPCARVLAATKSDKSSDIENGMATNFTPRGAGSRYPPRGGRNNGIGISWWYWIPCGVNLWLQTHSTDMKFLGKRTADILSSELVTKKLASGDLLIGISEVAHVQEVVRNSVAASHVLQDLLG